MGWWWRCRRSLLQFPHQGRWDPSTLCSTLQPVWKLTRLRSMHPELLLVSVGERCSCKSARTDDEMQPYALASTSASVRAPGVSASGLGRYRSHAVNCLVCLWLHCCADVQGASLTQASQVVPGPSASAPPSLQVRCCSCLLMEPGRVSCRHACLPANSLFTPHDMPCAIRCVRPSCLQGYAWAALGKLCMVDEALAKKCAPLLVQVREGPCHDGARMHAPGCTLHMHPTASLLGAQRHHTKPGGPLNMLAMRCIVQHMFIRREFWCDHMR